MSTVAVNDKNRRNWTEPLTNKGFAESGAHDKDGHLKLQATDDGTSVITSPKNSLNAVRDELDSKRQYITNNWIKRAIYIFHCIGASLLVFSKAFTRYREKK